MSWNLFDRIINAIKPGKESEQPVDTQPSCPEGASEQPSKPDHRLSQTQPIPITTCSLGLTPAHPQAGDKIKNSAIICVYSTHAIPPCQAQIRVNPRLKTLCPLWPKKLTATEVSTYEIRHTKYEIRATRHQTTNSRQSIKFCP